MNLFDVLPIQLANLLQIYKSWFSPIQFVFFSEQYSTVHHNICFFLFYVNITKKHSEPADLRQGHVVRRVAAPYSVWQRFPLCPIESNVNENFKVIQNPGLLPDHPQNWTTGSFSIPDIPRKFQKDPSITFWVILLTHKLTDKQTEVWQKHNLLGGGNYIGIFTVGFYGLLWRNGLERVFDILITS